MLWSLRPSLCHTSFVPAVTVTFCGMNELSRDEIVTVPDWTGASVADVALGFATVFPVLPIVLDPQAAPMATSVNALVITPAARRRRCRRVSRRPPSLVIIRTSGGIKPPDPELDSCLRCVDDRVGDVKGRTPDGSRRAARAAA